MTTFAELGVSDAVVSALQERGIAEAFPIQTATVEAALAGRDICGKAPTGSGKTLAFGIPAVDLSNEGTPWHPAVLILSPTRELATQIKDELEPLAKSRGRSILTVFGGTNIQRDIKRLEKGVDILVACPGRLEDLIGRRCCDLRNVELVVVDEADRMADMGFLPTVKRILDQTPGNRHTLLFSATLDGDVDMLIKRYQEDPLTFEVEEQVGDIGNVEHSWYLVQPVDRIGSAVAVLRRYYSSIVFCRTRRGCDRVAKMFAKNGLPAVAIHGDRSQGQRERALRDFTSGKAQVLVATDVAARGIHVDNVELVMHYDPAGSDKDYIHRSGRTGRAGQDGRVISMVVEDKKKIARALQKDLGMKPGFDDLEAAELPGIVNRPTPAPEPERQPQARQGNKGGSGRGGSGKGGGGKNRSRNNRDQRDRNDRDDRDPNDRGGRGRSGNSGKQGGSRNRNDRDRNDRDRNDRNDRDNRDDRGSRGRPSNRNDRDDRGSRGRSSNRNDRDRNDRGTGGRDADRDNRSPYGSKNRNDRDDRDERRADGKRRAPRRRAGSNDWFPPGYHDDDKRGSGRAGKKNSRSGGKRDDERDERSTAGRGTAKKKSRTTKGRHSDQGASKNKGKRRTPQK